MADYDPPYRSRRNNPDDAPPPSRYRERTNDASPGDRLARAPTAPAQDRDLRDRGDRDRGDRGDRDRLARNVTDVGPRERDRDRDRERDRDRDRDRDRERRDDQPEGERERGYRGGADLQRDRRRDPSRPAGAERRDRSRPPLDRLDRDYRDRERERDPDRDRYAPETRDGRDPRDLRMDRDPSKGRDGRDPRDARDLRDGRDIRERPSARTREPTEDGRSERGEGRRPGAGINDLLKDLGDFAAKDGPPSGGKPEDPLPDPRLAGQSTRVPIIPRGSSRRNNTGRADPRDEAGPQTSSDATSDAGRSGRSRSIERSRGEGSQPSARPLRNLMERTGTLDSRSGRPAPTVTDDDGKTAVGGVPNLANPPRKRNGSISSSSVTAIETAIADPSAISSMLPDALNDSKSYAVLTPERIEDRRREFAVLSSQVSSLQNRLTLESRIREAALNVAKSTSPNDRAQAKAAQEQLSAANRKVDAIATDLWKVTGKLMEVERVVLKHTAGVLRFCVNNDTDGKKGNAQSTSPADRVKLESAETKVKEYEKEISVLKSTISRLENDNADTKKELSKEQDNLRRAERSLADNDRIIRSLESEVKSQRSRGPMSPVGNNEVNRLKLELATCRAEMATHQEDLTLAREKLDKQQNEMDELVQNMDEKDRMISNLLGELEEVTNKLEMKTAANDALMSAGVSTGPIATTPASSSASERQLRAQVAALEAELREATKAIAQGGSRSSTIMREQVAQQVNVQTENVRALLSKQLKDAVTEREKLKAQLANERARATDLEFEVSDLRDRLESGGGSRRGGGRGGSDTEDEGYGKPRSRGITTRKGGKDDGPGAVSDADLRALQRLHSDLPSLTPTRAAADSSDSSPFSVDGLVTKVTRLLTEKRDLARTRDAMDEDLRRARDDAEDALGTVRKLESDLRRAKDDAATAARAAEVAERDLKSQLRAAERAVDRLKEDLAEAERRGQQAESMSSVSATNATKKLEEAQAAHARELANANERAERRIREAERIAAEAAAKSDAKVEDLRKQLESANERADRRAREAERGISDNVTKAVAKAEEEAQRKLRQLERDLEEEMEGEREEMAQKLAAEREMAKKVETDLRDQLSQAEARFRRELESVEGKVKRDLSDAIEKERSRAARIRDELEKEIDELASQVQEANQMVEVETKKRIQEAEAKLEREWKRKLETAETTFREQMLDAREAFKEEMEQAQLAHNDELERTREQLLRENTQELRDLETRLTAEKASLEKELLMRVSGEADSLKAKHQAAMDQLQSRHDDEMKRLRSEHDNAVDEMKARLARSEASLLTSKSQFFEDRERLNETIDQLNEKVRQHRQAEQDAVAAAATRQRDLDNTIDKLRDDVRRAQSDADKARDDLDRKVREIAQQEQRHRQQILQVESECAERIKELEGHLEDFEAVRLELESVERDYIAELSKYDAEKLKIERDLAESREAQSSLRSQVETLQKRLDQSQREVQEARSSSARRDPAQDRMMQQEMERMQKTIVELKTAKNELLQEVDDQGIRVQSLQGELTRCQRDYEKALRNIRDWDSERKRYETTMTNQREEISSLQTRLQDLSVDRLGLSPTSSEPPSTQKLRAEFRRMVADLRQDYAGQLQREVTLRAQLETQLRQASKQRDADLYNSHDLGTQTVLKWVTGEDPQRIYYGV